MASANKLSDDFTQGSISGKLIKFMVPILGALILQAMYGAVDLLIVGRFGSASGISAVSTGSNIINLVTFVISSLTMGVTVLISRYLGEKRSDRIGNLIGGAVVFFVALAAVLTAVMLIFAPVFAGLLNAPEEAFDLTVTYTRICGGGLIFVIAYNVISGVFRGLGNSKLPLVFVAIACCVNIAGDLLFIAGLNMDVAGAALATIMAQAVSVILSLVIITHQKLPFSLSRKNIRWNGEIIRFIQLGAPLALQEVLTNVSFLIVCAIINNIGLEASSGYGIAQKLIQFLMLIPSSLMQSLSAFVAQNVGAGKEDRAVKSMKIGMTISAVVGIFIALFTFFYGYMPAGIFTNNPDYIAKAWEYLRGFCPEIVLTSFVFSFIGYFNGHSRTLPVMLQGITSSFLVRIPLSFLFSLRADGSVFAIGIASPIASVYGIIFFLICYRIEKNRMKTGIQK